MPLLVYCASFAPALLVSPSPFAETSLPGLQQSVKAPHTYQSMWADWVLNWRAIWYLYEGVDGAQRGVMLIGNPLTMLIALPALAWCAWAALVRRRMDALAVLVLYAAALGFWIVAAKPTQFYYHYFAASCFLLAALSLALDALWQRGLRWPMIGTVGASLTLFAFYYPILSAAPLDNIRSFEKWSWLESWT